jgi:hypothetical protein
LKESLEISCVAVGLKMFFTGVYGDFKQAKSGAVKLIQPFGSDLSLNTYFHMLFLEGGLAKIHGVAPPLPD